MISKKITSHLGRALVVCVFASLGLVPSLSQAGSLSVSSGTAPATVDLTALGTTDWAHWAFFQPDDINRKAGAGALIGNYSLLGGASTLRRTTTSGYLWSDGDPQELVAVPRRKGLRTRTVGGGFGLSIPASTDTATLRLFLGAQNVSGTLTASLSDSSAAPVVVNVTADSGRQTLEAVLVFTADTATGTALELSYVLDTANTNTGAIFLEAATLAVAGAPGNQPPVLDAIGEITLTEGDTLALALTASDVEDPLDLVFTQSNTLPSSPDILSDNGDGTGTLDWISNAGDAAGSPYEIDVVVTDTNGAQDTETVMVTVLSGGTGSGGLLMGAAEVTPALVDLTVVGEDDWVRWATSAGTPVVSKAGGAGAIGTFLPMDSSNILAFNASKAKHKWSDGSPIAAVTTSRSGFRVQQPGEGFQFSLPADTALREFTLYIGARNAMAQLQGTLSDGSAMPLIVDVLTTAKNSHAIAVSYRANGAGETLDLSLVFDSKPSGGGGWVSIEAAAMVVIGGGNNFELPYTEDFATGAADWSVTDEAIGFASDWRAQNDRYEQLSFMGFTANAVQGAQHVGTLSHLDGAGSLTDYTFSVTMQPIVGVVRSFSQDIGALVHYNPATGDQLRFSKSGANGFSRLERRSAGVVSTLAQNSIGFADVAAQDLVITVQGPVVTVTLDGQKLAGAYETELSQGTVGLYCRNACGFDNVAIDPVDPSAALFVAKPLSNSVVTNTTFAVSAVVVNSEAGATVEFDVPGETSPCTAAVETSRGLFEASCTVSGTGSYSVEATYFDAQSVPRDTDTRTNVGVGDYYIALGDSITSGVDDSTASDAVAANGLYLGTQGFQAMLADRLSNSSKPVVVSNNGVPGDTSTHILNSRIDGVLERHPDASHLLLTVGVNEAGGGTFLPSGIGCIGAACDGTFKGNIQSIVDAAIAANLVPVVAQTPPRFGDPFQVPYTSPASHPRNELIRDEYNEVIMNELAGVTLGPDLFRTFLGPENRFYLYATNLHPNALGYHVMAAEFEAAITGNPQSVFYVTDFCLKLQTSNNCQKPLTYKQNLVEVGSDLYVDRSSKITGTIPAALQDGRWIMTAHANRNRTNLNHLEFDVPTTSTLYVAYDADATSLPAWLANDFTATSMSLTISGDLGSVMTLYQQDNVLGTVTLGGANANSNGAAVNYVVVVVEN